MSTEQESVLRDPAFVRYLVARTLSGAGNIVTLVALPILVYRMSDSASLTALVAALEAAPYFVFGLLAGALTDRWNRKRVMVLADAASAGLILSLPLAHWLAEVTVPHILVVAFFGPALGVFFDGAVFGAIPTLVGRGRIAEANSISWGLQSGNEILVPSLVGISLILLDPSTLLLFDALSFAVSAAVIATIVRPMHDAERLRPPLTRRVLLGDIREGLDYLVHHPGVRTMTIISFLQCLAGGGFVALMVVWIDRELGVGTEGLRFGLVWGAWAVGGLVAALALPRVLRRHRPERITLLALPFSAVGALVVPLLSVWWVAALGLAAWSVSYTLIVINSISYRQIVTPEHLLGRVNTAGRMLSWGMGWTGGAFLAGALVGLLGLVATLEAMSAMIAVAVVVAWTSPLRRAASEPVTSDAVTS
ncbi:MAG: MFS transporter [Nocardioides sp.]